MPSVVQVAENLEYRYLYGAPKANRENNKRVIQIYRENNNVTRNIAEKVVMSLYLPSAFGQVGKMGQTKKGGRDVRRVCEQIPGHQRRRRET